jgi:ferredoxin
MTQKYRFDLQPRTCIFCAACSSAAPGHFFVDADQESAYVLKQPETGAELAACRAAMINCPTSSIRETPVE